MQHHRHPHPGWGKVHTSLQEGNKVYRKDITPGPSTGDVRAAGWSDTISGDVGHRGACSPEAVSSECQEGHHSPSTGQVPPLRPPPGLCIPHTFPLCLVSKRFICSKDTERGRKRELSMHCHFPKGRNSREPGQSRQCGTPSGPLGGRSDPSRWLIFCSFPGATAGSQIGNEAAGTQLARVTGRGSMAVPQLSPLHPAFQKPLLK